MTRLRLNGSDLQDAIVDLARTLGWRAAHFAAARTKDGWRTPARYDAAGWPDLTLVRERVVFIEVKGDGDSLRPEQQAWIDQLEAAGQEVYVATSRMWRDGVVDDVLKRVEEVAG